MLEQNLPSELNSTIKDLLIKEESEATTVYKDCKTRILKFHGPKPEHNVALAQGLVMTGLPSQAGRRIRELICKKEKFDTCCCAAVVGKFWRDLLPQPVKTAVASIDLETNFDRAMDAADDAFNSMAKPGAAAVAAVSLDDTLPALQYDVAAVRANNNNKPAGKKAGAAAGRKKMRRDPTNRDTWGKPHPDFNGQTPPKTICMQHYVFGKNAHYCRRTDCPWESFVKPVKDN